MRAVAVALVMAAACGHPQSAPPTTEHPAASTDAPPPPVVDAADVAVAVATPDAAPDAAIDAAPEVPAVACWDNPHSHRIVQVLRVRITDTGEGGNAHGRETWAVVYAEAEVLEVIRGDMTRVDKRFRKHIYAVSE